MAALTVAILSKGTTIQEIHKVISNLYSEVELEEGYKTMSYICFKSKNKNRRLSISLNANSCKEYYGIEGVWCSLGAWGNSIKILKTLCENFGGHLDENDCDDKTFYYIEKL